MNKILLGMAAASAMLFATTASASLIVKVDETTDALAAVVIADGSALDASAATAGLITNTTSTTNFNVVTSTAFGSTLLAFPDLFDLASNVVSTGAGTLQVSLTETGFTGFDYSGFLSGGSIATGGTGDFKLYVGSNDGEFELSQLIASGSVGAGPYSLSDAGSLNGLISGTFSLTLVTTLVADSAGDFFSTDTKVVPEPSILALMSLGLVGLGFAGRRKLK